MPVSLKTLAEECGLAQGTVSNILASRGAYAEETRRLVVEAAKRHGYVPSRLATSLRDKCSTAVGILMTNLTDPYFAELLDSLSREISSRGLEVMVSTSGLKPGAEVFEVYQSFLSWRLRAFLICTDMREVPPPSDLVRVMSSTAVITLNTNPWSQCSAVYPDRVQIARIALDHLVSLGHRRIGVLAYTDEPNHYKLETLRHEMHKRGLSLLPQDFVYIPQAVSVQCSETEAAAGFELGKQWAGKTDRPTAFIATTDAIASRFAAGFMAGGGRVPAELSIVAYNHTHFGAIASIPLTAVGVPMARFARSTLEVMKEAIDAGEQGEAFARHLALPPELIVRQSTGPSPRVAGR